MNIYEFDIFTKNLSTLKETSKNDSDKNNIIYLTKSEIDVIDFDKVKEAYIKNIHPHVTPSSNDTLLEHKGELFFIEFKDGNMKKEIHNVKRKIFESLLIFLDITQKNISFTRANMNYILVYNADSSKIWIDKIIEDRQKESEELDKHEVQESGYFENIISNLSDLSKYYIDIFSLKNQFGNMYFKDVFTYTSEQFDKNFVSDL